MDKRKFAVLAVILIAASAYWCAIASVMENAEQKNQQMIELHQEVDKQAQTIKTMQTTITQQEKEIKAAQAKASDAEKAAASRP